MAKRGSTSSRFAKLIRHFNFQQRTVVDPNTQEETIEEIPVLENVSLEASTDVTVAGEQVITTASQYVNDEQISESSITQHQAALSITESQISDLQNYLTTPFPSGTRMLFQQTSAPTGWTKQTTHNNKALRVVSGTAGSGGSVAFTTALASKTPSGSVSVSGTVSVANKALNSTSLMPSHNHEMNRKEGGGGHSGGYHYYLGGGGYLPRSTVRSNGGNGNHNHGASFSGSGSFSGNAIDLRVLYVDIIIATKD